MKITIENTTKIVELAAPSGVGVPARIWQGTTDSGVRVICYVTRIAVHKSAGQDEIDKFERELRECATPAADVAAIPLRLII